MTTRDRLRPAVLARRVLLPPVLAGGALTCLLAALAVTVAGGARTHEGNPLAPAPGHAQLVVALSTDLEGTPAPRDVRRARRPLPERLRLLQRHPYFRLYTRAQRRFDVPWVLVASVHYQETGFEPARARSRSAARKKPRTAADVVMAIAAQLRASDAPRSIGPSALPALAKRYGPSEEGRVSAAMVIERARAWRVLGTIPAPGIGELARPVAGVMGGCGYFGCPRPGHLHSGVDFLAPAGTPVHAVDAATVALVETPAESGGYGNFVCLQHRPHLASCYAHLSAIAAAVRPGARVRRGEVIGLVGSTGSSTAPHLHFELRAGAAACQSCAIDPLALLSGEVPQRSVPRMLRASTATIAPPGAEVGEPGVPKAVAPPATPSATPSATPVPSRRPPHRTRAVPGSGGASAGDPLPGSGQATTGSQPTGGRPTGSQPTGGAAPSAAATDPSAAQAPADQATPQAPAASPPPPVPPAIPPAAPPAR